MNSRVTPAGRLLGSASVKLASIGQHVLAPEGLADVAVPAIRPGPATGAGESQNSRRRTSTVPIAITRGL